MPLIHGSAGADNQVAFKWITRRQGGDDEANKFSRMQATLYTNKKGP